MRLMTCLACNCSPRRPLSLIRCGEAWRSSSERSPTCVRACVPPRTSWSSKACTCDETGVRWSSKDARDEAGPLYKAARAPRDECDVKRRHEMTHMERGAQRS